MNDLEPTTCKDIANYIAYGLDLQEGRIESARHCGNVVYVEAKDGTQFRVTVEADQ